MCDRLAEATADIEVGLVVYNAGATHGARLPRPLA
jgi:hypothetical protein